MSKRSRSNSQVIEKERVEDDITYTVQEPQGTSLLFEQERELCSDRVLRALAISPAGRSISQFKTPLQPVETLDGAIEAHKPLLNYGDVLHRDVLDNNIIMVTDPAKADGFKGMLNDLELAKEIGQGPVGVRHRTGTMEFRAIEVLQGTPHTCRLDLEAFFYVLIWVCARCG